jgi:hypothetical protein
MQGLFYTLDTDHTHTKAQGLFYSLDNTLKHIIDTHTPTPTSPPTHTGEEDADIETLLFDEPEGAQCPANHHGGVLQCVLYA